MAKGHFHPGISERYAPVDIYNCDETGLYYRALPDSGIVYKHEKPQGSKLNKERITVLACANMNGSDKRTLFVIGKAANP